MKASFMKNFPSLRSFMLLKETHEPNHSAHCELRSPAQMVSYYDIAKKSWQKYGDAGPPIKTKVVTLRSGHGGEAGMYKNIISIINNRGFSYFELQGNKSKKLWNGDPSSSWALVDQWWLHFTPVKDITNESLRQLIQ